MFMLAPCRMQTGDAALVEGAPSSNRRLNQITRRALASGEGTPEAQLLMYQDIKRYSIKESTVALMTRGSTGVSEKQNGSSKHCLSAIYVGLHLHLSEEPGTRQYILATNMVRS